MLFDEIKEIIASQLEIDENIIDRKSNIYDDLGADILDMTDIVMAVEDEYAVEITPEAFDEIKLVEDLLFCVESNANQSF